MSVDLHSPGGLQADLGYEGQIASGAHGTVRSRVNSGSAAIPFGRAVGLGTTTGTCKLIDANGDTVVGISVMRPIHPLGGGVTTTGYNQYDDVNILNEGCIYAKAQETVKDGDKVVALVSQNSSSETVPGGSFGSARNGKVGTGRLDVPNAVWLGDVVKGAIGKIAITTGVTVYSAT